MAKAKERARLMRQRRRYRARSAVWLTRNSEAAAPGSVEQRDGTQACHLCERYFTRKRLTIDHIVPKSLWRWATECEASTNKTLVCRRCNQAKGQDMPDHPGCELCYQAVFIYSEVIDVNVIADRHKQADKMQKRILEGASNSELYLEFNANPSAVSNSRRRLGVDRFGQPRVNSSP